MEGIKKITATLVALIMIISSCMMLFRNIVYAINATTLSIPLW